MGALSSLLNAKCAAASKIPEITTKEVETHVRDFSFDDKSMVPLVDISNELCCKRKISLSLAFESTISG